MGWMLKMSQLLRLFCDFITKCNKISLFDGTCVYRSKAVCVLLRCDLLHLFSFDFFVFTAFFMELGNANDKYNMVRHYVLPFLFIWQASCHRTYLEIVVSFVSFKIASCISMFMPRIQRCVHFKSWVVRLGGYLMDTTLDWTYSYVSAFLCSENSLHIQCCLKALACQAFV